MVPAAAPTADLSRGEATRRHIKLVALRLFATQSLEAVSIRAIVKAAGQKNAGSINYYFRSKDALIRELIEDVARLLDAHHQRLLSALEASGDPITVRGILAILTAPPDSMAEDGGDDHALRFLAMVMINHRDLLFQVVQGGVDRGIRRCFEHLRQLLPDYPAPLVQQRLMLAMLYLFAVGSSREAAREQPEAWRNLWGHPAAHENLLDAMEGLLTEPPSPGTLAALATPAPKLQKAAERRRRGQN